MKKIIFTSLFLIFCFNNLFGQEMLRDLEWVQEIGSNGAYYIDGTSRSGSGVLDIDEEIKSEIEYQLRMAGLEVGDYQEGKNGYFMFSVRLLKSGPNDFFLDGGLFFYQNLVDESGNEQAVITWKDTIYGVYSSKYAAENDAVEKFKESNKEFIKSYFQYN